MNKRLTALILSLVFTLSIFSGCTKSPQQAQSGTAAESQTTESQVTDVTDATDVTDEDVVVYGENYSDVLSVSAYLYEWEELPPNYITKKEAENLGWVSSKGNLWDVAYGMSIGGDRFGNREGILPQGEEYRECDINYEGGYRGGERLVYSIDDYDIYYTADHYESFVQVYSYEDGYVMELEIVFE